MNDGLFDVLIAGGGPSGLQAALTLGRARKRVLVADGGPRRNGPADHMNNFVSRDGIFTDKLADDVRAKLLAAKVEIESGVVTRLVGTGHQLEAVELAGGRRVACEALLMQPPQKQVELVRALGVALGSSRTASTAC